MGIWNSVKKQLRSVIEWQETAGEDLFYRWSENGDEVKNASKLIVGPGQGVIFVYEGKVEAVHVEQGIINLETDNIPFLTTLKKFMQAFESEHKVGIYFFKTTKIVDLKWGTPSPVKYMDPKYNIPIELRAFGNFSVRITEPENFFVRFQQLFQLALIRRGTKVEKSDARIWTSCPLRKIRALRNCLGKNWFKGSWELLVGSRNTDKSVKFLSQHMCRQ